MNAPVPVVADERRGIAMMLLTTLVFAGMDTLAKLLMQSYPLVQVVWGRYFFHAVFLVVVLGRSLPRHLGSRRPGLQLLRSALLLVTTGLFFLGVAYLPLVDAVSIAFVGPLIVTALSVPLLGEKVGARRWMAVIIGFCGALLIIRPGSGVMQAAALLPLLSAATNALYQIITRILSRHDGPITTLIYSAVVGGLVSSVLLPLFWVMPDATGWALMALLGLLGGIGHFTLIRALSLAPAATVAPIGYTNLVWSTGFGFVVFSHLPDGWTLAGAAVIIGSGFYVFRREQQLKRAGG